MATQVGELFILGFRTRQIPNWMRNFASEYGLGGVILFDYDCTDRKYVRNVFNPDQARELCAEIHALPSHPMVFVDQEGGKVRRFKDKYGFKPLPSAKHFGKLNHAEQIAVLEPSFRELKDVGVDVNLSPVVDFDNPHSPDLGRVERSYASDPARIKSCVESVVAVAERIGLKLCLKHFPGCGGSKVNPHDELMDLSGSLSAEQVNLFKHLLARIPMVLFSHGTVHQWEAKIPVSMSTVAINKVRRWREDVVIVTDDLQMEGIQKLMGTAEASVRAVQAGADMLCIGNNMRDEQNQAQEFAQRILTACETEPNTYANVRASIQRVLKFKST